MVCIHEADALNSYSLGTFIFINLFGLSVNYPMAIITRFIWGFLNSSVGVVKTYVSEVNSRKTQSLGFSLLSVSSGLSRYLSNRIIINEYRVIGPLIGGLLANPQYTFPSFVNQFPLFKMVFFYRVFKNYLVPLLFAMFYCRHYLLFDLPHYIVFPSWNLIKRRFAKIKEIKESIQSMIITLYFDIRIGRVTEDHGKEAKR